jgi:organic radical activating enzyme
MFQHIFGYDTDILNEKSFLFMQNACDSTKPVQIEVDFTLICDNHCPYCYNKKNMESKNGLPNLPKLKEAVLKYAKEVSVVTILGGEPLLFPKELLDFVEFIRNNTKLKIILTSAMPNTCNSYKEEFYKILNIVDEFRISAHSYNQEIGDKSRNSKSTYCRNTLIKNILNYNPKCDVAIHLNLAQGIISDRESVLENYYFYDSMSDFSIKKFKYIRFTEIQLKENLPIFKDFDLIMGIKLPPMYSKGCYQNITHLFAASNTTAIVKRSCFLIAKHRTIESWKDLLKLFILSFIRKSRKHLVYIVDNNGNVSYSRVDTNSLEECSSK